MYKKPYRAKTIREKSVGNIQDYLNYKSIYKLIKKHSPNTIEFFEDKDDPWFVHVITYSNKTGKITDSSMIIASDVESWKTHLLHLDYKLNN